MPVNDPRTSTQRLPASDRRRQLVETALDFFSRKGFGGTTTKEIAAAAGVTEAIIFRHFPTKHDLYNAVSTTTTNSGRTRRVRRPVEDLYGSQRRRRPVPRHHRQDHREPIAATCADTACSCSPPWKATRPDSNTPASAQASRSLSCCASTSTRRQSEGAIREGNPGAIIAAVAGMATHYATMTQMFGFSVNSTDREMADSFVAILMHGIQENQQTQRAQ